MSAEVTVGVTGDAAVEGVSRRGTIGFWSDAFWRIRRDLTTMLAFGVIGTMIVLALGADVLADHVFKISFSKQDLLRIFERPSSRFLKREHLEKTQRFYEKHGGKTIVIARFVPIVRTFAPFVAGIGQMQYRRFALFNVSGAIVWVVGFIGAGHLFGNLPVVKQNFHYVILAIIVVSILPAGFEWWRARRDPAAG